MLIYTSVLPALGARGRETPTGIVGCDQGRPTTHWPTGRYRPEVGSEGGIVNYETAINDLRVGIIIIMLLVYLFMLKLAKLNARVRYLEDKLVIKTDVPQSEGRIKADG
jgi:hypothetical protein